MALLLTPLQSAAVTPEVNLRRDSMQMGSTLTLKPRTDVTGSPVSSPPPERTYVLQNFSLKWLSSRLKDLSVQNRRPTRPVIRRLCHVVLPQKKKENVFLPEWSILISVVVPGQTKGHYVSQVLQRQQIRGSKYLCFPMCQTFVWS